MYPQASDQTITGISWWMTHLAENPELQLLLYMLFQLAHEKGKLTRVVEYINQHTGALQRMIATTQTLPQSFACALTTLIEETEEKLVQHQPL